MCVADLKADKDKFRRAKSVSHIISKGLFHTNNRELLNEIAAFDPDAKGKEQKDRVDALVHALHMVQQYSPATFHARPEDRFKGMSSQEMFLKMAREQEFEGLSEDKTVINYSNSDFEGSEYY